MLLDTASVMLSHSSGVPAISGANTLPGADPPTACKQMEKQSPLFYVPLVVWDISAIVIKKKKVYFWSVTDVTFCH